MCDVLVATPRVTENGTMIFAKNSDRDPNEAQVLEFHPARRCEEEKVKLTYLEFPQIDETFSILVSRPWWMWGAEMGANEHGVVIGNTAVFTKFSVPIKGLLGMDILRLALERSENARDAVKFITSVIKKQGGNASHERKLRYHNSFIIADGKEAWVVETASELWVAKKVRKYYSISNALTIHDDWDIGSNSLKKGTDFSKEMSDRFYTYFARGRERRNFTMGRMKEMEGRINTEFMMQILRSHSKEPFHPAVGSMRDVCMHYGGLLRPSQTAASQVSEISEDSVHWFTATSNPCLSIFKPFRLNSETAEVIKVCGMDYAEGMYDGKSYWWRNELFNRAFIRNYSSLIGEFTTERNKVQKKVIEMKKRDNKLLDVIKVEDEFKKRWRPKLKGGRLPFLYARKWNRVNRKAGLTKIGF